MLRDGLVATLAFTFNHHNLRVAKIVTYEEGQTTVSIIQNFGKTHK